MSQEKTRIILRLKVVVDLRARDLAKAHQDANQAEVDVSFYLDRFLWYGEELKALRQERDELLRREDEARERARDLLAIAKRDR